MIADITAWRTQRDETAVRGALQELTRVAQSSQPGDNIMVPTITLAKAGGTTGEWADALRAIFGEYRAPTGVRAGVAVRGEQFANLVERSKAVTANRGTPPKILVPNRDWTATPTAPNRLR